MENYAVLMIPLEEIFVDSDFNCRGPISPFEVRDLMLSIEQDGLQTPLTIEKSEKTEGFKYRIIAGFRRFTAIKALKWKTVPCFVKENLTEVQAILYNFCENLKRKDLNPVQEAKTLEKFKILGYNANELAKLIGQNIWWIQSRYCILELPDDLQTDVASGLLRVQDAKKLAKLNSVQQQYEMAKQIKDAKIKGKKTDPKEERIIRKMTNQKVVRTRNEINEIQKVIMGVLGASFATICLAWSQGEISDKELHDAIKYEADLDGKIYSMPLHLRDAV